MVNSPVPGWAPVVYGRTAAADTWWQAVPGGTLPTGWLSRVVRAVFAGGRELEAHPRFLLARQPGQQIVGVACPAQHLSHQMHTDGTRELYCFVGWLATRPTGADQADLVGPGLDELLGSYPKWAATVYAKVMTPLWDTPMSVPRLPTATQPGAAPWQPSLQLAAEPVPCPGTGLWPAQTWERLWAAAMAVPDPLTCVVGWQRANSARRDGVTHLGAADAPLREPPIAPQPAPDPETPVLAPPPAARPDDAEVESPQPVPAPDVVPDAVPQPDAVSVPDAVPDAVRASETVRSRARARPSRASSSISLSRRAKIGVSSCLVAAAAVALVVALTENGTPAPPSVTFIAITSSGPPIPGAFLAYQHGMLRPGPRTARMAPLSGAFPASRAACLTQLGHTSASQLRPRPGQRICLELNGQPASYAIAAIEAVTPSSVKAAETIWP